MDFELDRAESGPNRETYYVYATVSGKKRCIGQLARNVRAGTWTAYAAGDPLAVARTAEEAAGKLLAFEEARRPSRAPGGRQATASRTVEERFARMRRAVPKRSHWTDQAVREARTLPVERRERLREEVDELIDDLEEQLLWWRKVKRELGLPPRLMRLK
ncbi:hypothetical protein [Paenibacillus sp.]|uniref:hypothetical protein n=1 Tax=Paenibacillus sp. TaxID=58172 RepID=UPI002D5BE0BA|nr:hypothetical protein [Paenibacillus sp.]HZG87486.1 hypothetical protein [Paenibacillus sp.]